MYQKIPISPGVYKDDTPLTAEGFFIDADKIRFRRGLPETMGGYELVTSVQLLGICRGLVSWSDNSFVKWVGVGTHTNYYAITDSIPYDITPVVSRAQGTSLSFTTTITSAVVTVTGWTSHGLVQGQAFRFLNSTTATVGGVTINTEAASASDPSPWFTVLSVASSSSITYTADSAATSSAGPTAVTLDYEIFLAPGLENSIGALGYSTGVYSTGSSYSAPATGDVFCRTHSLSSYGQNLIINPRGGKLYEWKPATSATELATNSTFTGSATGWTLGSGWVYGTDAVDGTAATGSISQSVTTPENAFNIVTVDVSAYTSGRLMLTYANTTYISDMSAAGVYKETFWSEGGASTLAAVGLSASMTVSEISVEQLLTAEVIPNAPTQNTCSLVTAEGFLMTFGTINAGTGNFDPMLIRWSDIGTKTNAQQTWTPGSTNLSSSSRPLVGSRIVAARVCNTEVLVWTDKALYALAYTSNSSLVYSTRLVGVNCGLIGSNAATVLGSSAYWMTPQGNFCSYAGGGVAFIPSGIQRDVFENISDVQQDKIYCNTIGQFNDVIWLYPDKRDGTECSRYALLCTQENAPSPPGVNLGGIGVFAPGTYDRTAWLDASGSNPYPIAVSSDGYIYYHEKGQSANGGTYSWSLTHGALQTGNGETLFMVDSLIPDFEQLIGGATYTAYSYYFPQSTPVAHGPFNITSASGTVDLLSDAPVGREIVQVFAGSASPAWMRAGKHQFDIQDTGMSF